MLERALSPLLGAALLTNVAAAAETKEYSRPYSPNEALLPAIRVKRDVDQAVSLLNDDGGTTDRGAVLKKLGSVFLEKRNYLGSLERRGVPKIPSEQYLESYKKMDGDLPLQAFLIKSGDVRTWRLLKQREKEREDADEVRAALNAYTDDLSFSAESYRLNVDRATRSTMIREDALPDVTRVITSDMGLRYLYRNRILTAMDDVRAEVAYQISSLRRDGDSGAEEEGTKELLNLLAKTQQAFDGWLDLIDPNDVRRAIDTVNAEK